MAKYNWFSYENSIDRIVEKFKQHDMNVPGVYSDYIRIENTYQIDEYLSPFEIGKTTINKTIVIQGKILGAKIFNEKTEHLYFMDMFRKLSTRLIFFHIAEPLFSCQIHNFDIQEELKIINEQRN